MNRSPSALSNRPPSPRTASEIRIPSPASPVGWNWWNSMSSSGRPLRNTTPMPSPVRVWALEVVLYMRPEPPVAITTALAWKTWIEPVASS